MDSTLPILAVDLDKFNSVPCWFHASSGEVRFRAVRTSPEELRRELTREPTSQVVFEACSQAGWMHNLCEECGERARRTPRGHHRRRTILGIGQPSDGP